MNVERPETSTISIVKTYVGPRHKIHVNMIDGQHHKSKNA